MNTTFSLLALLSVSGSLLAPLAAQGDEPLTVERQADQRGRDAVVRLCQDIRTRFHVEEMSPRDLCRTLSAATGDKVTFSCGNRSIAEGAPISLSIGQASLWSAMAVLQMQTGLRFVYRSGVVFLVPKEDVRPVAFVRVYNLRAQTMRLRSFPGPELRLPTGGDEGLLWPEEEETEQTVSGFTAEGVEALIQQHVTPDLWGGDRVSMSNNNGVFVIRHSVSGHRQIEELLLRLGLISPPRVYVRSAPAGAARATGRARVRSRPAR